MWCYSARHAEITEKKKTVGPIGLINFPTLFSFSCVASKSHKNLPIFVEMKRDILNKLLLLAKLMISLPKFSKNPAKLAVLGS